MVAPAPIPVAPAHPHVKNSTKTRVRVQRPGWEFDLPARRSEADGDRDHANEVYQAKVAERADHDLDKARLLRETEEERKRRERNDMQAVENEELRKRVQSDLRNLRRYQQERLHDMLHGEFNRRKEIRIREQEIKRNQRTQGTDRAVYADECAKLESCGQCVGDPMCGFCVTSDACLVSTDDGAPMFGKCDVWRTAAGSGFNATCPILDVEDGDEGAPLDVGVDDITDPACAHFAGPPGDCERAKLAGDLPASAADGRSQPLYQEEMLRLERLGREAEERGKQDAGRQAVLAHSASTDARRSRMEKALEKAGGTTCIKCVLDEVFNLTIAGQRTDSPLAARNLKIKTLFMQRRACESVTCVMEIDKKLHNVALSLTYLETGEGRGAALEDVAPGSPKAGKADELLRGRRP